MQGNPRPGRYYLVLFQRAIYYRIASLTKVKIVKASGSATNNWFHTLGYVFPLLCIGKTLMLTGGLILWRHF